MKTHIDTKDKAENDLIKTIFNDSAEDYDENSVQRPGF